MHHNGWAIIIGTVTALLLLMGMSTKTMAYPVAVLNADPLEGYIPLTVEFDGSDSWDTQGLPIERYEWKVNDGSSFIRRSDNARIKYTFHVPGIYKVFMTVHNIHGHNKTAHRLIKVFAIPHKYQPSPR